MGRKRKSTRKRKTRKKNIYLGGRVKDTGKRGLDNLGEVRGIANAIITDYKNHKIPYKNAMSRENLLSLVITRDNDFNNEKKAEARAIIDQARARLMKMRH